MTLIDYLNQQSGKSDRYISRPEYICMICRGGDDTKGALHAKSPLELHGAAAMPSRKIKLQAYQLIT